MTLLATLASMSTLVNGIGPAFKGIGEKATKMFNNLKTFVNDKFIKPLKEQLDGIKEWWTGFKETVQEKWQGIKDFISDNVVAPIQEKWQGIKDFISDNVVDPVQEKWGTLKEWFTGFKATVIEKWTGIKNFIMDKVVGPVMAKWEAFKGKITGLKDSAINTFNEIKSKITTTLSNLWDAIPTIPDFLTLDYWKGLATDIGSALGGIGDSIISGIKTGINALIGLFNDLLAGINFNKTVTNPFTGTEYSFGVDLSDWQIPQLAKGGIVNKPTLAMIGEDGPEAVVPLSQRNNPGGAGMGGGTYNITVNAGGITDRTDKRALAREIGNMIQQELARSIGGSTMRGRY
jgi:phage-related protein